MNPVKVGEQMQNCTENHARYQYKASTTYYAEGGWGETLVTAALGVQGVRRETRNWPMGYKRAIKSNRPNRSTNQVLFSCYIFSYE